MQRLAALVVLLPLAAAAQQNVEYRIVGFAPDSALAAGITSSAGDIDDVAWAEAAILDGDKRDRLEPPLRETLHFDRTKQPDGVEAVQQVSAKIAARLEERRAALRLGPWQPGVKLEVDAKGSASLDGRAAGRIHVASRQRKPVDEDDILPPGWLNLPWRPPEPRGLQLRGAASLAGRSGPPLVPPHGVPDPKHVARRAPHRLEAQLRG